VTGCCRTNVISLHECREVGGESVIHFVNLSLLLWARWREIEGYFSPPTLFPQITRFRFRDGFLGHSHFWLYVCVCPTYGRCID
jgi:hypothetical protein